MRPPHRIRIVIPLGPIILRFLEIHPDDVAEFAFGEIVVDVDATRLVIAEAETNPQLGRNHIRPFEDKIRRCLLNCQSPKNAAGQESSARDARIPEDVMAAVLIRLKICPSELVVEGAYGEAECRARIRILNLVRCSFTIDKRVEGYPWRNA